MVEALLTREAAEAATVARRQRAENAAAVADLVERLRIKRPAFVATCARGSSDHAATYGKYLIERTLGLPVASLGPSLASVYGGELDLSRAVFIAASQSGRSPDALLLTEAARRAGALVAGFVNDETSPLAGMVDVLVPLRAGPERSVAATKSFLATGIALLLTEAARRAGALVAGFVNDEASPLAGMVDVLVPLRAGPERSIAATKSFLATCLAFLHLSAEWAQDEALSAALAQAPEALDDAGRCDWTQALLSWREASSLYVIGRGLSFGIAQEIALKFKETCRIHAEAFSAAEVLHGPLALVGPGFPALALDPGDEGSESVCAAAAAFTGLGADLRYAGSHADLGEALPLPLGLPAALLPLAQARAFYGALAALAESRGLDPDRPPHLSKVTRTV